MSTATAIEPAGRAWCERFPTERTTAGLVLPFRRYVQNFITHLERRCGCTVEINATRRPEQRAWLMHHAWRITREGLDPAEVPARDDIAIAWTREGAAEMVEVYGLVARPSLTSRHITGQAIDMEVHGWTRGRPALERLGKAYGVVPLGASDPVHWSTDGR